MRRGLRATFWGLTLLTAVLIAASSGFGQGYFSERNDETYLILALKKQKASYDAARSEYTAALELKKRNLISNEEFERKKAAYINQEISYQQAMLRVIFDQPHILIEKAAKYQAADGKKRVRLTLQNTTGGVGARSIEVKLTALRGEIADSNTARFCFRRISLRHSICRPFSRAYNSASHLS